MNKFLSILLSISVIATTFAAPTISVAGDWGMRSDDGPDMWGADRNYRQHWQMTHDQSFHDQFRGDQEENWHRRQYRNNNDGAFIAGGVALLALGLILGSQQRHSAHRSLQRYDHVGYCMNRYRSYRAWDNTYQPNYGPRRICR